MSSGCGSRGDVAKGGKTKAKALKTKASEPDDAHTLYNIYTNIESFLTKARNTLATLYLEICLGRYRKQFLYK